MMSKKMKLIPELRFPEFVNDGEWIEKKLGNIGKFTGGGTPSKNNDSYWAGKHPWISSSDIAEDSIRQITTSRFITEKAINESATKIVPANSILIVSRVGVGKLAFTTEPICTSQDFINLTPTKDNLVFLAYYLKSHKKDLLAFNQGMAIKGFTKNDVESLKIYLPVSEKEQQKIAFCLSSLDELIAAHSDKLENLKDHKKGLMQNLFPQKGQKVPNYRFPEFEKDGEWEEKELGEICKFTGGGTPSKNKDSYWTGKFSWISSSDIAEDSINQITISRFITEQAIQESATKIVPANSILLVSRVGVGKLAFTTEPICTSQDFTNLTPINDNLVFLAYYLKSHKEDLLAFNQGMAIKGFTKKDVESLRIFLPVNEKEQQKIASCLSALDELITAQSERIEQLQQHKKGLMQGLFPNTSEIS